MTAKSPNRISRSDTERGVSGSEFLMSSLSFASRRDLRVAKTPRLLGWRNRPPRQRVAARGLMGSDVSAFGFRCSGERRTLEFASSVRSAHVRVSQGEPEQAEFDYEPSPISFARVVHRVRMVTTDLYDRADADRPLTRIQRAER